VEVKLHRTVFVMGKGGMFVVPRGNIAEFAKLIVGNFYSLKNVGDKDCRLFFAQAVEQAPEDSEED
jgi:hypothetical protein